MQGSYLPLRAATKPWFAPHQGNKNALPRLQQSIALKGPSFL